MGTVKRLAEEVARGLEPAHPELRKTVVQKLALAVGAMIEGQTPKALIGFCGHGRVLAFARHVPASPPAG
jgi:hypothetical protein